jgi:peptidyl-prolyl cis-trans isomerase D
VRLNTRIFASVSTKSLLLGFVIVMACCAFILTGFGSLNPTSLFGLDPNTAAQVGSEKIDMHQFSAILSSRVSNDSTSEQRKKAAKQIIDDLIQQKILEEQAKKIGWTVTEPELVAFIKSVPQFHKPSTTEFDLTLFQDYMKNQNTSEIEFYNYIKQQLESQKMQNLLYLPTAIPDAIAETQYKIDNTEFILQYALISFQKEKLKTKISEEAKKYSHQPENLTRLKSFYENSKEEYQQNAKIKVMSLLISYKTAERPQGEALTRTKEQAQEEIAQIQKKLKRGIPFEKLASEKNDDLQAKSNKGNIGFIDDTNIDIISAKAALALSPKEPLSQIIDTPFGFRILKYLDSKPAISRSFEEVKTELAEKIIANEITQNTEAEFQKNINQALAAKNISQFSALLSENKISWQYLSKPYKVSENFLSDLGSANELSENIFSLKKPGDFIPKIINFSGKYAVIKLVSKKIPPITPEKIKEMKTQLMSSWAQEFAQITQKDFVKKYEKNKKIKINQVLLQSGIL